MHKLITTVTLAASVVAALPAAAGAAKPRVSVTREAPVSRTSWARTSGASVTARATPTPRTTCARSPTT